jgi:DNA mismatch endonuclease (patch repair protein)
MPDVFTKRKRSEVMSRIRGRGNRDTELALLKILKTHRITGWRRHHPISGRPDFAFPVKRLAVFVDGCFWHRCPRCSNMPATNRAFWLRKLTGNVARDREVETRLLGRGWSVVRIWEHELRRPDAVLGRITRALDRLRRPQSGPFRSAGSRRT